MILDNTNHENKMLVIFNILSRFRCDGSPADFQPPCYPILPLTNNEPPCMRFVRSAAMCQLEGFPMEREQINDVTGVIDGNNVYGSSEETTRSLRVLQCK